jgi:hypothetical protein
MGLLSRIYYNAVFGALGGLVGWLLFSVFGLRNPDDQTPLFGNTSWPTLVDLQNLVGGALIGGAIGYLVVSSEALRDRALVRFVRLASYGLILSALGGALGLEVGDLVNYFLVQRIGADRSFSATLATMLARGLGWMFLGVAVGASEGLAARSLGRFSYSTIGGALGGFLGGALFGWVYNPERTPGESAMWTASGLVLLGACIGSLSALVRGLFQPASLRVLAGWQEGREYPLEKEFSRVGRDEHADIALFRDMRVEKLHIIIRRAGPRYLLINQGAPPEQTLVNDSPVADQRDLQDGDRIRLGNVLLRFQTRAAQNRLLRRPGPMLTAPPPQAVPLGPRLPSR